MLESMTPQHLKRSVLVFALAPALLSLPGCKAPQSFGDRHAVIVRAEPGLWAEVESDVLEALEQTVFTTRSERKFKVTFIGTDDPDWASLRLWQQILLIGSTDDPIVAETVNSDVVAPALVQTTELWARAQTVTVLYLPQDSQAEAVRELLPGLYDTLAEQYEEWVIERMFVTGVNDSLSSALAELGFTLQVPNVYMVSRDESVIRLGNPYRQGDTDLLRSLLITWEDGARDLTPDELRSWRATIGESRYTTPQEIQEDGFRYAEIEVDGRPGLEIRGVWKDRDEIPAAGPFITRAIPCRNQARTYYIDAWLFAPSVDKYPYVRQLEILLDSFRCVGN
jgi:hypothetical protein